MTLIKKKPWGQFFADPFFNEFPSLFEKNDEDYFPAINVIENEEDFQIELAVPGFKKGEFSIDVENNILTISAEHKEEKSEDKKKYKRCEFSYNRFQRSFSIPDNIDEKKVKAAYDDGILRINLEKNVIENKREKKHIEVK